MSQENMKVESKDGKLIITVDLTKTLRPSKSGKNTLIATTNGSIKEAGVVIGLNVYKPI